jgi:phage gp16-like protein
MSKLARNHRNSDLVKIHIAKKQLNLSDDEYRAILSGRGGADSAKDLDHAGRQRVLDYFKTRGFKPKAGASASAGAKRPARPTPSVDALPLVRRIRAQLISLDRLPDEYADGIAQQMLGQDAPQFFEWCSLPDLGRISQALTYQQKREGAPEK